MFHSIVFISGPCASRPAPYSFPLRFSGRGDGRPSSPPRRLPNPHAGPARSRRSSVPRPRFSVSRTNPAFCPSDRLSGCSHTSPGRHRAASGRPHPTDRETHRPVSEPDPTVAGNRPFGALRLRSLPCHTAIPPRIGKGRCAPPHSAAAPRRQTADPHCPSSEHRLHRTASDTRSSIHGSRGAPNPEHASRHARSPGGRPVRKRRREPTDAGAGLRKPVAAKTARPAARTVRRKKPGEKSPSAQNPAANERPPAGATAANRRKGPV